MPDLPEDCMTEESRVQLRRKQDEHLDLIKNATASGASLSDAHAHADRMTDIQKFVRTQIDVTAGL
jgi:hypothetical protein